MSSNLRRRMRNVAKYERLERKFSVKYDGTVYDVLLYAKANACVAEIWRSLGDGLWERVARQSCYGDTSRAQLVRGVVIPAIERNRYTLEGGN